MRRPFLLESSSTDSRFGRFSFAGIDPFRVLSGGADALGGLRGHLREHWLPGDDFPTPLPAGAVGFLSYDLGRRLEPRLELAADDDGLPDVELGLYDAVVTWDHVADLAWIVSTGLPLRGADAARRARERADELEALLEGSAPPDAREVRPDSPLESTFTRAGYEHAVRRAKQLIAAGDIFQVNLSQRFSASVAEPGTAIYRRLTGTNPAAFAAYLAAGGGAEILSASPERFLRVSGTGVESCPIKGTRPRGADPEADRALASELLTSEKDRAELTMIVDLVRNDLGRVARFGTVEVKEFPALTSHPTVHHLHGTVTAELDEGRDITDLVRACFPAGSITGAPKVRAMEIIEETEPVRRGVYTGSIGYLSFTGAADLNVAIRTVLVKDGTASFSVGGGIVADSEPGAEYEETLDKGRGLAAALGFAL
ncbi:MAG: aminodeoxychorismate synthase component I [Planctomycetota bacterium]